MENEPHVPTTTPAGEPAQVSLIGAAGHEVALNLFRLSAGEVRISDLGSAYSRMEDGTVDVRLDDESAAVFFSR